MAKYYLRNWIERENKLSEKKTELDLPSALIVDDNSHWWHMNDEVKVEEHIPDLISDIKEFIFYYELGKNYSGFITELENLLYKND